MKEFKNYCGRGFAYNTHVWGNDKLFPNSRDEVIKKKDKYDPRLIAKFNVEDDSEETIIYGGLEYHDISVLSNFTKIEVDGVEISLTDLDENFGYYQLSEGEHTIRYTLSDPLDIGEASFYNCKGLTNVTIPDSVTSISERAFSVCTGLTSITILNNVTSIGNYAFTGCTGLTSIIIPNSVTSIGTDAFTGCTGFTNIVVDSANNVYDSRNSCNAIIETATNTLIVGCQNTTIPNTVTAIGDTAFKYYNALTSITIPDSVTSIGIEAFSNCSGLTNIIIPNSVISIGERTFQDCTSLTSMTIGSGVTSIGNYAFRGCRSLNNITSSTTTAPTIQNSTFSGVKTNGTLTVPNNSTGYDVWMGSGNYYLGKYSWTKIEQ